MKDTFSAAISKGLFSKAHNILIQIPQEKQINFLLEIVLESSSVAIYTFVVFLIIHTGETAHLHYCAAEILTVGLTYLEGAYSAALLHARRAAELDPKDFSYKEYLLLFYSIPEHLIDAYEAHTIAEEILVQDPFNRTALRISNETKEKCNG